MLSDLEGFINIIVRTFPFPCLIVQAQASSQSFIHSLSHSSKPPYVEMKYVFSVATLAVLACAGPLNKGQTANCVTGVVILNYALSLEDKFYREGLANYTQADFIAVTFQTHSMKISRRSPTMRLPTSRSLAVLSKVPRLQSAHTLSHPPAQSLSWLSPVFLRVSEFQLTLELLLQSWTRPTSQLPVPS